MWKNLLSLYRLLKYIYTCGYISVTFFSSSTAVRRILYTRVLKNPYRSSSHGKKSTSLQTQSHSLSLGFVPTIERDGFTAVNLFPMGKPWGPPYYYRLIHTWAICASDSTAAAVASRGRPWSGYMKSSRARRCAASGTTVLARVCMAPRSAFSIKG